MTGIMREISLVLPHPSDTHRNSWITFVIHQLWHCPLALIAMATAKQFIELGRDPVVTWHTQARRISEISRTPL
jgi:hypothetical protein